MFHSKCDKDKRNALLLMLLPYGAAVVVVAFWAYDLENVLRLRNVSVQPTQHQTKAKWQPYQFKLIRRCLFSTGTHSKHVSERVGYMCSEREGYMESERNRNLSAPDFCLISIVCPFKIYITSSGIVSVGNGKCVGKRETNEQSKLFNWVLNRYRENILL